jgi:hypothetical protein
MLQWLKVLACGIHGLVTRRQLDEDFQRELDAHLDMLTEENRRRGLPPEEARRAAQLRETYRELWGLPWLETLLQDIRYGLRQLRRNPGFTAVAVLTLALGLGANTAIFSVVNTVLLRPLPYRDADRLVTVWSYNRSRGFNTDLVSPLDFGDWKSQNQVFESMAASTEAEYTLTGAGEPALVIAYSFSADYFHVLGSCRCSVVHFCPRKISQARIMLPS